mgnify:CR=1 FL=1|tara:strand:+ start:215 stop:433 length:219 start_codon:yes stop_codon:yes gene_type:complete
MENTVDLSENTSSASVSFRPEGVAPFTYGLWRHFVLIGALHLVWLFVLLIAQMAGYHGFDSFVASFLGLGGR